MHRDNFYTVMSHYDSEGTKSRHVKRVSGRTFFFKSHPFGIYYDGEAKLHRLIDLCSGKQIHQDSDMDHAISRLRIGPFYEHFIDITNTEDYKALCQEYDSLIAEWEAEHKCIS